MQLNAIGKALAHNHNVRNAIAGGQVCNTMTGLLTVVELTVDAKVDNQPSVVHVEALARLQYNMHSVSNTFEGLSRPAQTTKGKVDEVRRRLSVPGDNADYDRAARPV